MLGCQLIINHGNSTAAEQGLQVSLLVALSYLPATGDYTLCLSPQNTICLSPLQMKTVTLYCNSLTPLCDL